MRRILLLLAVSLTTALAWAVKADPTPIIVTQPDGTRLTVVLHGDEHINWYSTLDGVLLVQTNAGYFVADIDDNGELTATRQLAHDRNERQATELALVEQQPRDRFFAASQQKLLKQSSARKAQHIKEEATLFPHTGTPKALVLLVDFPDEPFSLPDPKKSFEQYLNGSGEPVDYGNGESRNYGSVKEYFHDSSNGAFTPQFDIYGPYRLPQNLHTVYGLGRYDNISELMKDACTAANADVNFADYDANNDGKVDLVYIIYAGYSASVNGNVETCIWPKSGSFSFQGTYDGKSIMRYGVNNELNYWPEATSSKIINGIGLFCHEFSHCMGLPDMYAKDTATGYKHNNQGMETWDVMDNGCYSNNGYCPVPYTAWEQEVMGWNTIEELKGYYDELVIDPLEKPGGKAYKVVNPKNEREYVVLQNIQNVNWHSVTGRQGYGYDAQGKTLYSNRAHGLLAYRVCYAQDEVYLDDYPNNLLGQARMLVLPASGDLLNADITDAELHAKQFASHPYPGEKNVTAINNFKL
ncbi:MAG: M6 family metalloprotease domain-containing protein, partial [Prevotella sp.]|nr:M6 family metalloprotease domain-containing protein [Prevotella sp.]